MLLVAYASKLYIATKIIPEIKGKGVHAKECLLVEGPED